MENHYDDSNNVTLVENNGMENNLLGDAVVSNGGSCNTADGEQNSSDEKSFLPAIQDVECHISENSSDLAQQLAPLSPPAPPPPKKKRVYYYTKKPGRPRKHPLPVMSPPMGLEQYCEFSAEDDFDRTSNSPMASTGQAADAQRWDEVEDDDIHFFKSILPFIRCLPPIRKLAVRSEIQNLVLKELTEAEKNSKTSNTTESN